MLDLSEISGAKIRFLDDWQKYDTALYFEKPARF